MRSNEQLMAMAMMMSMGGLMPVALGAGKPRTSVRHKAFDPIEGVDIAEEYTLVKMKKSQLSFSQRQEVIRRFEGAKSIAHKE